MAEIENIRLKKVELKYSDTEDPVAQRTSWEPAKSGGANFKTHKMMVDGFRIKIEGTKGALVFALIFAIPGLIALFVGIPYAIMTGEYFPVVFILLWGLVFSAAGIYMLKTRRGFTFDKTKSVYYSGKEYRPEGAQDREKQGKLDDVYAIQLISERVRSRSKSSSSSYSSYELNLVFEDGERVNVMDHGKREDIEADAKILANFLDVPIWQAVH